MQTTHMADHWSLERSRVRTHPPGGVSLDDAARIAATLRKGGRAPRCPYCGKGLTVTRGTSPERTVVVLACEACGSSLALEAHRTASIPVADEHREMLRATHVKPLPPIHGLGPGRLGILRRRMGRGRSDSGTDGEWRAR